MVRRSGGVTGHVALAGHRAVGAMIEAGTAQGWGITSNLSHPGVAPTSLLAPRAELGRDQPARGRRLIGGLSARGILFGTVESAGLPALLAATSLDAQGRHFYGPRGIGNLGGAPAEQRLYRPLRSVEDAERVCEVVHVEGLHI